MKTRIIIRRLNGRLEQADFFFKLFLRLIENLRVEFCEVSSSKKNIFDYLILCKEINLIGMKLLSAGFFFIVDHPQIILLPLLHF